MIKTKINTSQYNTSLVKVRGMISKTKINTSQYNTSLVKVRGDDQ